MEATASGPSSSRLRPLVRDLSEDAKSMIRSGVRIPSVTQAALELVHNAIDSGANDILVTLNLVSFKLQVKDNGNGIEKGALGTIAERYATSKSGASNDMLPSFGDSTAHTAAAAAYGFRGETLSSLREISRQVSVSVRLRFVGGL